MKNERVATIVLLIVALALSTLMGVIISKSNEKPSSLTTPVAGTPEAYLLELEKYVLKEDPTYSYKLLPEYTTRDIDGSYTVFVLNMTSQTWLSRNRVTHTVWWHFMTVIIPDEIVYPDVGCLYVTGDSNDDEPRNPLTDPEFKLVTALSLRTGMVCAMQRQNPNGPIKFFDDSEKKYRRSDDLIAYTFKYFLQGHLDEPEAVLLLPMVKSLVRGMDTITNFVDHRIQRFFVAGASKRGWATWLAASVDKRIISIAPLVLDFLNIQANMAHHYRSLNGWSWALYDYWYHNVTSYMSDPTAVYLSNMIDPYVYREKLRLPKYIITAGSDEFFLPDDAHYFYKGMLGPTFLRVHPNTDHLLVGKYRELVDEIAGCIHMVLEGAPFPNVEWSRSEGAGIASIRVKSDIEPTKITAWSADSFTDTRRDFRVLVASTPNTTEIRAQPTIYRDIGVGREETNGDGWIATVETPRVGWNCFFIEMTFAAPKNSHIVITTEVHITPDTFPAEDCQGLECRGTLV